MSYSRRRPLHPNLLQALNTSREVYTAIVWHFALEVLEPAYLYDLSVGQWIDILDGWAMAHKHLTPEQLPWRTAAGSEKAAVSGRGSGTLGSKAPSTPRPELSEVEVGSKEELVAAIRPTPHLPISRPKPAQGTFSTPQAAVPQSPTPEVRLAEASDSSAYYPLGYREEHFDPAATGPNFQRMYGHDAHKRVAPAAGGADMTAVPGAVRPIGPSVADQDLDGTSLQTPSLDPNQYLGDHGPPARRAPQVVHHPTPAQSLVQELASTMPSAQDAPSGVGDTSVMSALTEEELNG